MAAYDGYRSQPDPHQPPYPSTYGQTYDPRTYQSSSYKDSHYHHSPPRPRSRASSQAPQDGPPQPLNNALNNAFDKLDTARGVDADLIAQIAAEVKKSVLDEIKLNGVGVAQPAPAHATAPPPQYIPQSPTSTSASFTSGHGYTPPSPRHYDFSSQSHGSASPDPLAHDPMFDGSADTPTPRDYSRSAPVDIPNDRTSRSRPAPTSRMSNDFTPIEKMWQHLFDPQGQPTPRLGQFLRGLALHLILDYEPKKSLVIPPSKMLQFYNDVKLNDEIYSWQTIFGKLPYSAISKLFRDLRCEHHFIQENLAEPPQVPALTPKGFEVWMSVMIQAYPDTEYTRLSKAVLDMPISNADDFKERFPKELPRRLFPNQENLQAQQRCAAVLSAEGVGPLRRAPTFPPPPPPMSYNSSGAPPVLERERNPYVTRPDSKAVESDEDDSPLSMPLERERKPYSSIPGGGKIHEDDLSQSMHSNGSAHHKRTQSTASQGQWNSSSHQPRTWSQAQDAEMKRNDWARRQAEEDPAIGGHQRRNTTGTDSSYNSQPRSVYDDDQYKSRNGSNGYDNRGYEPRRY